MSLDDLARRAAEESREHAASGGDLDPERYRRRRERRNQARALVVSAAFVVVALLIGILVSPPEEEVAVTTSTLPREITTTTLPVTTTTVGPEPSVGPLLGAAWEELDPGPIAGRYRMAVAWTSEGLFVFGGHDNYSQEAPSNVLFHSDAFLYDPVDETWRALAEIPREVFEVGQARAVGMGGRVFVYGQPRAPLSGHAAIYDLEADAWVAVAREFGDALGPTTEVVWTGELLVATNIALAYDPATGATLTNVLDGMMATPADADASVHSPQRAHWSGSEILVVGSGPAYAWVPGEEGEWRTLAQPPVPDRARDSVWTDQGLLVVNYEMATAFLDPVSNVWTRPGDLPLRFYECLPEALTVSGIPVVRMCSGLAIWDEVRASWIPVPLGRYGGNPEWGWSDLVAGDDDIFSIGGEGFLRYRISRDEDGRIVLPPTMPIGVMLLDVPEGFVLAGSFAPQRDPEGFIPGDETIGLVFWPDPGTSGPVCTVSSSNSTGEWRPPTFLAAPNGTNSFEVVGPVTITRPGRSDLNGTAYQRRGEWNGIVFPDANGSDLVFVTCGASGDESDAGLADFAAGLWSPWEVLRASADPSIGTGWQAVERSPIAGRMRIAATWTGEELFAWGGHAGYSQEVPGSTEFHQDAYLYRPDANVWRRAASTPDGLCWLAESSATRVGDSVLVHGAVSFTSDCVGSAAIYDPVGDSWTVLEAEFFDRVPFDAQVVWTGKWLAAPAFGLAWVVAEDGGETIQIPVVPDSGFRVGSPTMFHWDGERIVAVGAGDVYSLRLGDEAWEHHAAIGIAQGGRRSVLTEHGLFVITRDGEGARLVDLEEVNLGENLPLRLSECDAFLVAAGDLPVAQVGCSGMAIWDPVRSFWVPIPMDVLSGWAWQPILVGTDDAVYSIGEEVLRYPISHHPDIGVVDPPTIPVGVMQLDLASHVFRIRTTIGVSQVTWPEGWVGDVIAIALDGLGGLCHVTSTYNGPTLDEPIDTLSVPRVARDWPVPRPERAPLEVLDYTEEGDRMTDWVIRSSPDSDGDVVGIQCESRDDALLLAKGLWLP